VSYDWTMDGETRDSLAISDLTDGTEMSDDVADDGIWWAVQIKRRCRLVFWT
jgi:hypothetical protein